MLQFWTLSKFVVLRAAKHSQDSVADIAGFMHLSISLDRELAESLQYWTLVVAFSVIAILQAEPISSWQDLRVSKCSRSIVCKWKRLIQSCGKPAYPVLLSEQDELAWTPSRAAVKISKVWLKFPLYQNNRKSNKEKGSRRNVYLWSLFFNNFFESFNSFRLSL